LGVAVWFTPTILVHTGLGPWLIEFTFARAGVKFTVGDVTAGWFSPVQITNMSIHDAGGNRLMTVAAIATTKNLAELVLNRRDMGAIQIDQPHLHAVLGEQGTNLDKLLGAILETKSNQRALFDTSVVVEIRDGQLAVSDNQSRQIAALDNVQLALKIAARESVTMSAAADAAHEAGPGAIDVEFSWQLPRKPSADDLGDGELAIEGQHFPLEVLLPLLRQAVSDLAITGHMDGRLQCHWDGKADAPALRLNGNLSGNAVQFAAPKALGPDRLETKTLAAVLDARVENREVRLDTMSIDSDVGRMQLTGSISLDDLSHRLSARLADWRSSHSGRIVADFELSRLASMLPQTLHLESNTHVTSGKMRVDLRTERDGAQRVWRGSITTEGVSGHSHGRPVAWREPLKIELDALASADGWHLRELDIRSEFLEIHGSGQPSEGRITLQGDLNRLTEQLGQFSHLGAFQLEGRLSGEASWKPTGESGREAQVSLVVQGFRYGRDKQLLWSEEQLVVRAFALGTLERHALHRLDKVSVTLESGGDRLDGSLIEPVNKPWDDPEWPLVWRMDGTLETWLPRVRPWLRLSGWELGGQFSTQTRGRFSAQRVQLDDCHVKVANFKAHAPGWSIDEPQIQLDGQLVWDLPSHRIDFPEMTGTSSSLAFRARDVEFSSQPENLHASGSAAFRGDLRRVTSWKVKNPLQPEQQLAGQFQGQIQMSTLRQVVSFQGSAACADFTFDTRPPSFVSNGIFVSAQAPWNRLWYEAQLQIQAEGRYDAPADRLEFDRLTVVGDAAQINARGVVQQLAGPSQADLKGEIDYDLLGISRKLQARFGPGLLFVGRQRQPFSLRGPLRASSVTVGPASSDLPVSQSDGRPRVSPALSATSTLGWDSANLYGLQIGPHSLAARLERGIVQLDRIEASLNQGRVTLTPRLELNSQPPVLVIEDGVAEGIHITSDMCHSWLKYVAPLLAGVTSAEGQVSLALSSARIPASRIPAAELAGTLTIHKARVGPGGLAHQLLAVTRDLSTLIGRQNQPLALANPDQHWINVPPQKVDFQMNQGRVYHRDLQMAVGNVSVRTQGWVATDQSISLIAEIAIPEEWLEGRRLLSGLRGQSLQVPIHGTLMQPQLDQSAIAQLSQQVLGATAERLIQDELMQGLEKLLGR
jgi:hypothetical protein